ncbi:MAG: regulatory protein RecX [bacterium]
MKDMTVRTMTALGRTKVRIEPEEGEPFVISQKDAFLLGIKEGALLEQDVCEEIGQILRRECLRRCGMMLQSRDYSASALEERLSRAGFPSSVYLRVIEELKAARYVDEERMAEDFVRSHLKDRSRKRIEADLAGKGLSEECIRNAFLAVGEEHDLKAAEREQILRLLEKKHFDPEKAGWEETMKIRAFLGRRGFSGEAVRDALEGEF